MKRLIFLVMILIIVFGALPMSSCNADNAENPSSNLAYPSQQQFQGVTGLVTSRDGHPIANAWIQAKSLDEPSNPIPELVITTNEAGEYQWSLLPGRYEISVLIDSRQQATNLVTVQPGQTAISNFTISAQ